MFSTLSDLIILISDLVVDAVVLIERLAVVPGVFIVVCDLAALRASIPLSKGVHLKEKSVSLELMLLFLCFAFVRSGKPMDPHLNRMIIIKQLAAWKHRSFLDCNSRSDCTC